MSDNASALTWTTCAIARMERDSVRPLRHPRLTEPGWTSWRRIAGRLGAPDFLRILHDDLASAFPTAFDLRQWPADPIAELDHDAAQALLEAAAAAQFSDTLTFLRAAAAGLGLPSGGSLSALPKVQAFQRVVELPGAAYRIAAHQVLAFSDLSFDRQFVFVADSPAERTLIGLAALELRSNPPEIVTTAGLEDLLRSDTRIDRAYGLNGWSGADEAIAFTRAAGKDVRCV